jgi:hypothetical protein
MPAPPEIWIVQRVEGIESVQFVIINLAVRDLIVAVAVTKRWEGCAVIMRALKPITQPQPRTRRIGRNNCPVAFLTEIDVYGHRKPQSSMTGSGTTTSSIRVRYTWNKRTSRAGDI